MNTNFSLVDDILKSHISYRHSIDDLWEALCRLSSLDCFAARKRNLRTRRPVFEGIHHWWEPLFRRQALPARRHRDW